MSVGLHEGRDDQRIDVVFDVCRDNSINKPGRGKRGSESGHKFRILKADHEIYQWWQFLSNSYKIAPDQIQGRI